MAESRCPGCGARLEERVGPTHRYMESSPACWAVFGEVLAREYSDPAYFQVHKLSVDAYAVQHPGKPSPQTIQSVAVHLIRLCLLLEKNLPVERANQAMLAAAEAKRNYVWLTPPVTPYSVTVADVHRAKDAEEHRKLVQEWAAYTWEAWSAHNEVIDGWLPEGFV